MISIWKKMKSRKSGKPYYKNILTNESKWNVPNKNGILREVKESNNTFIIYIPNVNEYNLDYSLEYAPKIDPSMVVPETSSSNTSQVQVAEHVCGFIVFFDRMLESGYYHRMEKIPYLNIKIDHVLARSDEDDENYFTKVPTLEHLHRLWQSSDNYVRLLKNELSRGGFLCKLHRDKFSRCGIERTLFITEKADAGASALLIQSNWKKENIVIDIDGIISGNIHPRSRVLGEFFTDPEKIRHTFFNDYEGLIDIESIEFNKTIVNSVSVISTLILYSAETAIREIERSLRNSKNPFIDSIHMYYQNNCNRLGGPHSNGIYSNVEYHILDFQELSTDELCSSDDGGILLCWIVLAFLSDAITYKEYLQLKNDIEKDSILLTKHELDIKYIMIVLKKVLPNGNQHYRQELAKAKCILQRKFVHTDLQLPFIEK
jgi:hypothetical protein